MRARVLVSDAETPAALAVVRSLGRAGHRVDVLAHSPDAMAAASHHRTATVGVPDPVRDPDGWTGALLRALRTYGRDVFVPVTDTAMLLADRARAELERRVRLAMPSREVLATALDKPSVLTRAAALGIPVLPRRTGERIADAPLPAVLKPRSSRVLAGGRVRAATASVFGDRAALAAAAAALEAEGLGAYAEPWVPGVGHGIFLLLDGGEVLARFAHRRIREAAPLGGPSAAAESVAAHPVLLAHAEALARDLRLDGPVMVEFRGQGEDFVLLEANVRYWGSLGLALDAGVDFPRLHVAAILGAPERGPETWRTGLGRRHLALDLRRAGRALRGGPPAPGLPWPDPVGAVLDLLSGPRGGLVRSGADPAPGRAMLRGIARGRRHDG